MSLIVKICGLNTPVTLDVALSAGADMVGLVFFAKSPRHVGLDEARALAAQARGRAELVVLTVDADDALLGAIAEDIRPDWLQLHGSEPVEQVAGVRRSYGIPVMKAVGVALEADIARARAYAPVADRLLLDAKPLPGATRPGGNGLAFDWRLIVGLDLAKPFMLSGGLMPDNVAEAIRLTRPFGIDVSSGVERAPGEKDPERIRAFIEAARAAEQAPGPVAKDGVA